MRYAVISDIHSNLEALEAFLDQADKLKADKIICLGDIVGYNPNPNECIELIRKNKMQCLMGNHDSRVAGIEDASDFNLLAARAIDWTIGVLKDENLLFLKNLPRSLLVDRKFLAIHGWVSDTDRYIMGPGDALRNFELMNGLEKPVSLCFFGHTHVPAAYIEEGGSVELTPDNPVKIEKGRKYLINPGAIGQPRDRDPRASFLIYDSKKSQVNFYRVEYDISSTAGKIIEAGLPERLAERLKLGW
ncbi:MAG: metallophosphoesterase family protein [Deltaproteobacteria bacterium]|nr:metallophosphoesterase family protein [Deltaproteobacteria bacterium]